MSSYRNKLLLLCPAAIKSAANIAAAQVLGPGNEQTFQAGFSSSGSAPATHFAACSVMEDSFVEQLVRLAAAFPTIRAWVAGPADFSRLEPFSSQVTIGEFVPHDVLADLNLFPVS